MAIDPVVIVSTGMVAREPSMRTEPFPNCLSICAKVASICLRRSSIKLPR